MSTLTDLIERTEFLEGYIACLMWDRDDEEDPNAALSPEAHAQCEADCLAFQQQALLHLLVAYQQVGYTTSAAGHDFWLTRNHHGAGFWDRKALEEYELGDALTHLCANFPSVDAYVGDDGLIYLA